MPAALPATRLYFSASLTFSVARVTTGRKRPANGARVYYSDIGNTATEIMDTIGVGSGALQADGTRKVEPMFPVEDAARAVLLMAGMPASASVGSVVITAAGMPFVGRG